MIDRKDMTRLEEQAGDLQLLFTIPPSGSKFPDQTMLRMRWIDGTYCLVCITPESPYPKNVFRTISALSLLPHWRPGLRLVPRTIDRETNYADITRRVAKVCNPHPADSTNG